MAMEKQYERWTTEHRIGDQCVFLYTYSRGPCQGRSHYASISGEWEWFFWTDPTDCRFERS